MVQLAMLCIPTDRRNIIPLHHQYETQRATDIRRPQGNQRIPRKSCVAGTCSYGPPYCKTNIHCSCDLLLNVLSTLAIQIPHFPEYLDTAHLHRPLLRGFHGESVRRDSFTDDGDPRCHHHLRAKRHIERRASSSDEGEHSRHHGQ